MSAIGAAIDFAIQERDWDFLRCWNEGNFEAIRREWPEAPEEVFIGADPMHPATKVKQDAYRNAEFYGATPPAEAQEETRDLLDWPLPCDIVDGAVTLRKGVPLRTLLTRMKMLVEAYHRVRKASAHGDSERLDWLAGAASKGFVSLCFEIDNAQNYPDKNDIRQAIDAARSALAQQGSK